MPTPPNLLLGSTVLVTSKALNFDKVPGHVVAVNIDGSINVNVLSPVLGITSVEELKQSDGPRGDGWMTCEQASSIAAAEQQQAPNARMAPVSSSTPIPTGGGGTGAPK